MSRSLKVALAAAAVAVVVGGCGGGSRSAVSVHITVTTYTGGKEMRAFTLGCRPLSGTLPLAARVCSDIARHPQAMLDPLPPRSTCLGLSMPQVAVTTKANGRQGSFAGSPNCGWPGTTGLAIYFAAAQRDERGLRLTELRLRCDDDPALLARPTPWASVAACTHGLWTPRTERLIRLAEQARAIAVLQPRSLFPSDIDARRCAIPAGGPVRRTLAGLCGVSVKDVWSTPTVTFVESWPISGHAHARAVLQVAVTNGRARLSARRGSLSPQLRR